jgi:hypothetical protein
VAVAAMATATDEVKKKRRARKTVMKTIGDEEELMFVCLCVCFTVSSLSDFYTAVILLMRR